jgi:hypothetical protein
LRSEYAQTIKAVHFPPENVLREVDKYPANHVDPPPGTNLEGSA